MSASVMFASGGVAASGGPDCHLNSGCGFPAPGAEIFLFDEIANFTIGNLEFGITKVTILLFVCVFLILGFFIYAFREPKLVPRGAQNVGEMGYLFIRDGIARDTIGKDGDKFVPFLMSFFFLVWLSNFMGIVPFAQIPSRRSSRSRWPSPSSCTSRGCRSVSTSRVSAASSRTCCSRRACPRRCTSC